ncbi:hypothetical protein ACIBIZ_03165 [Nonomuraea spiralis]|uniref:hypothetical protein n=1 Tax=Nonomuraea spiralis TaxID=46182 RepID=UPI00378E9F1B
MPHPDALHLGREATRLLALSGVCELRPGLTDREFARIEAEYDIEFADDHRAFLAGGLPINSARPEEGATWERPWPDWRDGDEEELRRHLEWPIHDVDRAPGNDAETVRIAGHEFARPLKLIPLYAHRFIPAGRGTYGSPVLSIWGSDMITYGRDLIDYVRHDFYRQDDDL